jgi:pimeloyl-ACP methyl ester carboxylesterase
VKAPHEVAQAREAAGEARIGHARALAERLGRDRETPPDQVVVWWTSGRLAIVGGSMGGAMAPLVAAGQPVAAVAVWGTFARTWLEHLVALERRRLTLSGDAPGVVSDKMRGLGALHARILSERILPRQALAARPDLQALWPGEPEGLYGRPASFHHQAQAANIAAAWERVTAPVLAVHGEFDWIMSRADHELIAEVVNRDRPGTARFVSIPRTDHHFMAFESPVKAFRNEGGHYNGEATAAVVRFLRDHVHRPGGR